MIRNEKFKHLGKCPMRSYTLLQGSDDLGVRMSGGSVRTSKKGFKDRDLTIQIKTEGGGPLH